MTSPRRLVAIGLAALVGVGLLAGCGGHSAAPAPNDFDQPTTTTTTTDPYAVPAVIDAAYVERVLDALEDVRADVRRDVVANHRFTQESRDKLAEAYGGDLLVTEMQVWSDQSMKATPSYVRTNPGAFRYHVERMLTASSGCLAAFVTVDDSAVIIDSKPGPERLVHAIPSKPGHWNRTPWKLVADAPATANQSGASC